ncbi:general substrate transporter, partial [Leucosporidium creatinivorum]
MVSVAKPSKTPPVYAAWENNTNPVWYKDPGLRKNTLFIVFLYLGTFVTGYDASYLNGLQAMPQWLEYFGNPTGSKLGLINACKYFPVLLIAPLVALCVDKLGRRPAIWLGCTVITAGGFIGAFATGLPMLYVGRVIVGAGNSFSNIGCVCLLNEITHPRLRSISSALYLTTFYVGSIASSWITFGTLKWDSEWSWRLPTLFQAFGPMILFVCTFFIPESPRWLIANGRPEQAQAILSRLHANGAERDELVDNEMHEIQSAIEREKQTGSSWASLFSTPGNRRRVAVILIVATGSQWNGIGILSYYLSPVLRLAGITNPTELAGINGGLAVFNLFIAMISATLVERVGRRPLWIVSTAGMLVGYIVITGISGAFAEHGGKATGLAVVPLIFITYGFYDIAWSPLSYSYPIEVLPFSIRAKGMTLFVWTQQLSLAFNQWVNPVALKAIAWKYYFVYLATLVIYLTLILWLFVETRC